ncbi:MAG TPA: aminoglycoside phosphotransferase family protein [Pseudomonadales bacterium]
MSSPKLDSPLATPRAEVDLSLERVGALLTEQHPDLAHLDLAALDAGWDNALFTLSDPAGDDGPTLLLRLPRRAVAARLIEHEQRWLPQLAPHLPIPVPAPLRTGTPGRGYPWRWSVLPWLEGNAADLEPPATDQADVLADFLAALHQPAPAQAPRNAFRGVPLAARQAVVEERLERLREHTADVTEAVLEAWRAGLQAPVARDERWVHGDLHARNVLVRHGRIRAVIDWGDLCCGDPATDLAAVWMLLDDPAARRRAIARYGAAPPGTWRRAAAWAASFGSVLLETGLADNLRHARMGQDTLRRLGEEPFIGELD